MSNLFRAIAVCTLIIPLINVVHADNDIVNTAKTPFANSLKMNAQQFDTWLSEELRKPKDKPDPKDIEQILKQRLAAGRYVSDESIVRVVSYWVDHESTSQLPSTASTYKLQFPQSHRFIGELLPVAEGRPLLKIHLLGQTSALFRMGRSADSELQTDEKLLEELTKLHLDIDQRRVRAILEMAQLMESKDKERAHKLYLKAFGYRWASVEEPQASQQLFEMHIKAASGLIRVNKGNLKFLQSLYLAPSVMNVLGRYLSEEIARAKLAEEKK